MENKRKKRDEPGENNQLFADEIYWIAALLEISLLGAAPIQLAFSGKSYIHAHPLPAASVITRVCTLYPPGSSAAAVPFSPLSWTPPPTDPFYPTVSVVSS
jgi:hypothetical protein